MEKAFSQLVSEKNEPVEESNGIFQRYKNPVLTADHAPLEWRYDINPETNPFLMERFGINSVLNAGAIRIDEKYLLVARVEGADRKSFFAVAESDNGLDRFEFWEYPVVMPETDDPDTNIYDIRGGGSMKTVGSMVFFAPKDVIPMRRPATSLRQLLNVVSPVQRT